MQCPNCRKVEKGNWLYTNHPSRNVALPDLNVMDEWNHDEDLNDPTYSEIVQISSPYSYFAYHFFWKFLFIP